MTGFTRRHDVLELVRARGARNVQARVEVLGLVLDGGLGEAVAGPMQVVGLAGVDDRPGGESTNTKLPAIVVRGSRSSASL
jgi:hypothetical protein